MKISGRTAALLISLMVAVAAGSLTAKAAGWPQSAFDEIDTARKAKKKTKSTARRARTSRRKPKSRGKVARRADPNSIAAAPATRPSTKKALNAESFSVKILRLMKARKAASNSSQPKGNPGSPAAKPAQKAVTALNSSDPSTPAPIIASPVVAPQRVAIIATGSIATTGKKNTGEPAITPLNVKPSTNGKPVAGVNTAMLRIPQNATPSAPQTAKPPAPIKSWQWRITKTHWSASDEAGFEEFVQQIGESKCRSVSSCLKSAKANPAFHASNPRRMSFYADCADLPYMLRSYYAWKNGLPFSYTSSMRPLGRTRDIRYSLHGNRVSKRTDLVASPLDARRVIPKIMHLSSANYRIPPLHKGKLPTDHYSVAISPKSIKPGTIIYDPNGHVVVVYKVTSDGRVRYIDSHPDNSLTRGTYGRKFSRARPSMGAGFKRWRPLKLVGASKLRNGSYRGGRIIHAKDADIKDWSVEQFYGTGEKRPKQWRRGKFTARGKKVGYYDFVRLRLASKNFRFDPLNETRSMVRALCEDIGYRVDAVNSAVKAGIHKRPQPGRLPRNIYGTDGDWEIYSSPSRDARLKTSFKELRDEVARFIKLNATGGKQINYTGDNLKRDLLAVYQSETKTCRISYTKSDGTTRELGFAAISKRLFKLSFDPYHCIERRWGASTPTELASCKDGKSKRNWYAAEVRLRNQIDRKYDLRMDFVLGDLRKGKAGSGVDTPPDIDVVKLLGGRPQTVATIDALKTEANAN